MNPTPPKFTVGEGVTIAFIALCLFASAATIITITCKILFSK